MANMGCRIVWFSPAIKDGHPLAEATLVKDNDWRRATAKLN